MELNYMSKNLIGHEVFAHSIYATGMHLMELCSKVSSLALQSTSFFFFFFPPQFGFPNYCLSGNYLAGYLPQE